MTDIHMSTSITLILSIIIFQTSDDFLGVIRVKPVVCLDGKYPVSPELQWFSIGRMGKIEGEVLAAFVLFLDVSIANTFIYTSYVQQDCVQEARGYPFSHATVFLQFTMIL